ncbi:hypothetical protein CB1_001913012 [Camelus ferus]|nr:hypothetical protein CB1_001913012 [Camelus ferus]
MLFIALVLVEVYHDIILENNMDFTDIIKFFNEMAKQHNTKQVLKLAWDPVFKSHGHGSTLMMALRDVTVLIASQNMSVSSSTALSVTNCLPPGAAGPAAEDGEGGKGAGAEAEAADNLEQLISSSMSTKSAKSGPEVSASASKEALQATVLRLPRYHCENPASCRSPTLSTDTLRKRRYRISLNLFNINPDKGIQFLISGGFIPHTPVGVAHFLLQHKGLSRQVIGEFLGNSEKQFNRDVLDTQGQINRATVDMNQVPGQPTGTGHSSLGWAVLGMGH